MGFWYFLFYSWLPNQWAMNNCIYVQQLVCYKIFVWSSQLILWPLLHPLHFIINDRNKSATSSLGKWRSSCSDNHKFLTRQALSILDRAFYASFQVINHITRKIWRSICPKASALCIHAPYQPNVHISCASSSHLISQWQISSPENQPFHNCNIDG